MAERNGLENRERERNIARWFMVICGTIFISFFLAPMTVPSGTIGPLSANANLIDYADSDPSSWGSSGNNDVGPHEHEDGEVVNHSSFGWTSLNPYAATVYAFGDLNCHQKHERSWTVNDNQLPVCTRDIGIFFGLFLGSLAFYLRGVNRWTVKDTCLSIVPDRYLRSTYLKNNRFLAWFACGLLLCLPLMFDGFLQLLTSYESTHVVRILTGIPFGFGLGILFIGMSCARAQYFQSADAVVLPGGVKFILQSSVKESE